MKECDDCGEKFTGQAVCEGCQLARDTPCASCGEYDGRHDMRCGWTQQDFDDERGDYLRDVAKEEGRI